MLTERSGMTSSETTPPPSPPPQPSQPPITCPMPVDPSLIPAPEPLTSTSSPFILVGSTQVYGLPVDAQTRCVHWSGPVDIVALSHPCCGRFYPCAECHDTVTEHPRETWPREGEEKCVLCGNCGYLMTAGEYMKASEEGACGCGHGFNPRCKLHWERYFSA